jgi:hypothetical protein
VGEANYFELFRINNQLNTPKNIARTKLTNPSSLLIGFRKSVAEKNTKESANKNSVNIANIMLKSFFISFGARDANYFELHLDSLLSQFNKLMEVY